MRRHLPKSVRRESRRFPRYYVRQGARLVSADGAALGACVMHDISAGGACLELKTPGDLPDYFILLLSHDGRLHRQCAVVWRAKDTLGVEFIREMPAKDLPAKDLPAKDLPAKDLSAKGP